MPRSIVFGNQSLLIGFDHNYIMRDIYYPHVGMENHLNGHKNRIGLWVDGNFSWIEGNDWKKEIKYADNTLIGKSYFVNQKIGIRLIFEDGVHIQKNIFLRRVEVENLFIRNRELRFFFTHDLQIYEQNIGITAYFDPDTQSIIHFFRNRYFLFAGSGNNRSFDSFATGKSHFGKEGTYKDAEDGHLSENPVDQGSVDSTIQINLSVSSPANKNEKDRNIIEYWFCAGNTYREVCSLHEFVIKRSIESLLKENRAYDTAWVNKHKIIFHELPSKIINLFNRSLLIIRTQTDRNGSIIAANDSDILQFNRDHYSYMWPRDGALVAFALDKAGYSTMTRRFYLFCSEIVGPKGVLLHKYNPDGTPGSTWHPWFKKGEGKVVAIQEDETALVLFSLWKHYEKYRDLDFVLELYDSFIVKAGDFLENFRDERGLPKPSYDLWEERRGVLTFTVSAVYAGLIAAANFAHLFGDEVREGKFKHAAEEVKLAMIDYLFDKKLNRFLRMINFSPEGEIQKDEIVDSSLFAIFEFGVLSADNPMVISTMEQIKEKLWVKTEVGGFARYENDYYHQVSNDLDNIPGNPWFICSLWMAEWYIHFADNLNSGKSAELMEKAEKLMIWVADRVLTSGLLAEQVDPYTNKPLSVSPLTWSHATFVLTVIEYLEKLSILKTCKSCQRKLPIFYEYQDH